MPRSAIPAQIKVLVAAAFVIAIGFGLVSPVLPAYARTFDVGVAAASLVVSVFALFRLLFAPAGGALVSKLGERRVYMAGLSIVAVSSLATAFAQSYTQLLITRGAGGVGSTLFTVSAMSLVVRLAPPEIRGRCSAAYASAFLLGGMLGPVLGGFLAEFGIRVPFVVYAFFLFAAVILVGVRLAGEQLRDAPESGVSQPAMTFAQAWVNPAFRAALASGFANGWANFGVRVAIVPQLAVAIYDTTWVAGVALACASVGTAATLQVSGRWADTYGRRRLVIVGLIASALGLGVMGVAHSLVVLLVLSVLSGIGGGLMNPAQQASLADVVGTERSGGKVLATFQMSQDAGAIVGPILIGIVADQLGFGWAFAITGMVSVLAVFPWLRAPETRPPEATEGGG